MWVVFVSNYGKHDCVCCKCDCGLQAEMRKMTTVMMSAPKPSLKRLSEDKNISWHHDVLFSSASRYSTAWPSVSLSPPRLNCCYSKPEVLWFPPCMHNFKCHFLFSETPTSEMYKNSVSHELGRMPWKLCHPEWPQMFPSSTNKHYRSVWRCFISVLRATVESKTLKALN